MILKGLNQGSATFNVSFVVIVIMLCATPDKKKPKKFPLHANVENPVFHTLYQMLADVSQGPVCFVIENVSFCVGSLGWRPLDVRQTQDKTAGY